MNDEHKDNKESSDSTNGAEEEMQEMSVELEDEHTSESTDGSEAPTEKDDQKETYDELYDRYLRLQAEFDNYRKRMNARFEELSQYASETLLLKILDVVDNLQRALDTDFTADPNAAKEGIAAIYRQVEKLLQNEQVRPIESVGKEFDPYYQHAINTINDTNTPDKTVVQEYQKGYMLREKVLRPAMVCVNRHPEPVTQPNGASTVDEEETTNGSEKENEGDI